MSGIIRQWTHAGLTCVLRHGASDCPCGYVEVPEGHPLRDKGELHAYDALDVHGGVTFFGQLPEMPEALFVGFDMGHVFDLDILDDMGCIRTDAECTAETERLAEQVAGMVRGKMYLVTLNDLRDIVASA